jgi:hypothetical protein
MDDRHMDPTEAIEFWRPMMGDMWCELAPDVSMKAKQLVFSDWLMRALRDDDIAALDPHGINVSASCDLYGIAVCCNVLYRTVLYCTVVYCTVFRCAFW